MATPNQKQIASMRGNLKQIESVPPEERTVKQQKALIRIRGAISDVMNRENERAERFRVKLDRFLASTIAFEEKPQLLRTTLAVLAYLANGRGRVPGAALAAYTGDNPLICSEAFDALAIQGFLTRADNGDLLLQPAAWRYLDGQP